MVPFDDMLVSCNTSGDRAPLPLPGMLDVESKVEMLGDAVKITLDELPDELRMVVILFYLEEFSYKEIARIVKCPV